MIFPSNPFFERLTKSILIFSVLLFWLTPAGAQCIATFPNSQDFETSTGGWTTGGTASDWAWGKPSKSIISYAASGQKCWITGGLNGTGYNNGEDAWVKSPCYNLSSLKYPAVGFRVYWETESNYDGTVFQYSTDNGATWNDAGSSSDPKNCLNLNWFNTPAIKYLNNGNGWSGSSVSGGGGCGSGGGSKAWVIASHTLPALAGKSNVQFRFLFGAGTSCNGYDGFAFDDFTVGEAPANFTTFNFSCNSATTVNFTSTSFLCPSLSWDFDDPGSGASNSSTLANPVHNFSGPGQFTVKLVASGPGNAPSTTTKVITILDLNTQIVASPLCNGDQNGSATVTPTPNIAGLNYSWNTSPAQLSNTAINLGKGTYVVTVSGANVCTAQDNITIDEPEVLSSSTITNQPTCNGNDGNITLGTTGGTAPYTYTWTPSISNTNAAVNLAAGDYSVIVKDKNQCTETRSFSLTASSGLTATITNKQDVICNGNKNGTATVTVSGGTAPYTYAWSPSGGSNATASSLNGGDYTVTVKDQAGCSTTATTTIAEPALLTSVISSTDAICGGNNGTANATISGGVLPYSYSWSPGGYNTAGISGLSPQDYYLTVKDKNDCKVSDVASIKAAGTTLSLQITATDIKCFGDKTGAAKVAVTGGTAPYTITWDNGASGAIASGLGKGSYTVTVIDALNCSNTASVVIAEPASALSLGLSGTDANCYNGKGSITSTISGGSPGYQYLWTPGGATTPDLNSVSAGAYHLAITDNNGCKTGTDYSVHEPDALVVDISVQSTSCGNKNGTANATVTGGTAPYIYAWTPGNLNTPNISNLAPGKYSLKVTDKNNCTQSGVADILTTSVMTLTVSHTNVKCFGDNTGSALVNVSGGVQPYAIAWSDGSTGALASNLAKGNYTVTVTDALNCSNTASVVIAEPALALSLGLSGADANCYNGMGSIKSTVSGGSPGYQYLWTPGGATTPDLNNVSAGAYHLAITDNNGCKTETDYNVKEPDALVVDIAIQSTSCGNKNGTANATVTGGTAPYIYAWTPGNSNTPNISNLAPGKYSLKVTDKNNCTQSGAADILTTSVMTLTVSHTNVKCFGDNTGSALVNVSGGVQPYTIAWSDGSTGALASNLAKGNYTVTVTDALNCSSSASVVITEPGAAALTVSLKGTDPLCNNGRGNITSIINNGMPGYQYLWTPGGASSPDLKNVGAGDYHLAITDINGCKASADYTMQQPAPIAIDIAVQNTSCGNNNGSANATVTGGTMPYTYTWTPAAGNSPDIFNLSPGKYLLTVTDKNGCSQTSSADIAASSLMSLQLSHTDVKCFGGQNATATVSVTGGIQPFSIAWSNGASSATAINLARGTYSVLVKDAGGCSMPASVSIDEPADLKVVLTAADALCNKGKGSITSTVSGGTPGYSYLWSAGGITGPSAAALPAGSYSLTVIDNNGCNASAGAVINEPAAISTALTVQNATCGNSNGSISAAVSGGLFPYSYLWTPGNQSTAAIKNLSTGNYALTVTDKNGCKAMDAATVTSPGNFLVQTTGNNVTCFGGKNGTAAVTVSGGSPAYDINWSNGMKTPSITNLSAGNYSVTVKDAGGCSSTNNLVITEPAALTAVLDSSPAACNINDGKIYSAVNGGVLPYAYAWQPGSANTQHLLNASPGSYTLTVTDKNGCIVTAAATVTKTNPLKINLGRDTGICSNDHFILSPGAFTSYAWQDNSTAASFNVWQAGRYWVTVKDQRGCVASDSITVFNDCGEIYFPNAFTPNSDSRNDKFGPLGNLVLISEFSMTVFNRWGEKVFETYNPATKWDGKYKGRMLAGTYVWFARFTGRTGLKTTRKGTVVLVR